MDLTHPEFAETVADAHDAADIPEPNIHPRLGNVVALSSRPRRNFIPRGCDQQQRLVPTIPTPAAESREGCAADDGAPIYQELPSLWTAFQILAGFLLFAGLDWLRDKATWSLVGAALALFALLLVGGGALVALFLRNS